MTDLGRPGAGSEGASVGGLTASPRSLQTLWPGPRESRRSWPLLCLDPASQRLPRPVGGRGVLRPTSARVRGDEETDFRSGKTVSGLQLLYPEDSCSQWECQQARRPTSESATLSSVLGGDSSHSGIGV